MLKSKGKAFLRGCVQFFDGDQRDLTRQLLLFGLRLVHCRGWFVACCGRCLSLVAVAFCCRRWLLLATVVGYRCRGCCLWLLRSFLFFTVVVVSLVAVVVVVGCRGCVVVSRLHSLVVAIVVGCRGRCRLLRSLSVVAVVVLVAGCRCCACCH